MRGGQGASPLLRAGPACREGGLLAGNTLPVVYPPASAAAIVSPGIFWFDLRAAQPKLDDAEFNFLTVEDAQAMRAAADKPPLEHTSSLDSLLSLIQALPEAEDRPAGTAAGPQSPKTPCADRRPRLGNAGELPAAAGESTPVPNAEKPEDLFFQRTPRATVEDAPTQAPATPTHAAAVSTPQRMVEAPKPKQVKDSITPGQALNEGRVLCYKKKQTKKATVHLLDELFSAPVLCQPIKQRNLPASFYSIDPPARYVQRVRSMC